MNVQELIRALQALDVAPNCEVIIEGTGAAVCQTVIKVALCRQDADDICWDDRDFKIPSHNAPPIEETTRVVVLDRP